MQIFLIICQFRINFLLFLLPIKFNANLIKRRSRRDMSPQGRKRVAGMVSRDYQTVSGIGGGSQTYQQVSNNFHIN